MADCRGDSSINEIISIFFVLNKSIRVCSVFVRKWCFQFTYIFCFFYRLSLPFGFFCASRVCLCVLRNIDDDDDDMTCVCVCVFDSNNTTKANRSENWMRICECVDMFNSPGQLCARRARMKQNINECQTKTNRNRRESETITNNVQLVATVKSTKCEKVHFQFVQ